MSQKQMNSYDEHAAEFARVRALIMKIINKQPGLTVEQISKEFLLRNGFLPRIDNRMRELRTIGWILSMQDITTGSTRLRWYPNKTPEPEHDF